MKTRSDGNIAQFSPSSRGKLSSVQFFFFCSTPLAIGRKPLVFFFFLFFFSRFHFNARHRDDRERKQYKRFRKRTLTAIALYGRRFRYNADNASEIEKFIRDVVNHIITVRLTRRFSRSRQTTNINDRYIWSPRPVE